MFQISVRVLLNKGTEQYKTMRKITSCIICSLRSNNHLLQYTFKMIGRYLTTTDISFQNFINHFSNLIYALKTIEFIFHKRRKISTR